MRNSRRASSLWVLALCVAGLIPPVTLGNPDAMAPNTLTPEEEKGGWRLLFDGKTSSAWRKDSTMDMNTGWSPAQDGALMRGGSQNGYIRTREEFENFELRLECAIPKEGDGGVFFRIWDDVGYMFNRGPEFQIQDPFRMSDGWDPLTIAGSCVRLYPANKDVSRPIGEYNDIRLIVRGNHVEHWMNGDSIVSYDIGTKDWINRLNRTAFANKSRFGLGPRGFIGLQALAGSVRYRNIKILPLPPGLPASILISTGRRPRGSGAWILTLPGREVRSGTMILDLQGRVVGPTYRRIAGIPLLHQR